jgi:hypothetical protein
MAGKQHVTTGFHGNRYTMIEELLETVFSTGSNPRLYNEHKLDNLTSHCHEAIAAENRQSSSC